MNKAERLQAAAIAAPGIRDTRPARKVHVWNPETGQVVGTLNSREVARKVAERAKIELGSEGLKSVGECVHCASTVYKKPRASVVRCEQCRKEARKKYEKKRSQDPKFKARAAARQRRLRRGEYGETIKQKRQSSEYRDYMSSYLKAYRQREDVKQHIGQYRKRPDVLEKKREYEARVRQTPKRKAYMQAYYRAHKCTPATHSKNA